MTDMVRHVTTRPVDCKRASDASSGLGKDSYSSEASDVTGSLDSLTEDSRALLSGPEQNRAVLSGPQQNRRLPSDSTKNRALLTDLNQNRALLSASEKNLVLLSGSEKHRALLGEDERVTRIICNPYSIRFIDDDDDTQHCDVQDGDVGDNDRVEDGVEESTLGVKFLDDEDDGDSICSSSTGSDGDMVSEGRGKNKAPDGGWGWVIVVASFFISSIADGISFSFGLLYVELLKYFSGSSWQTSLVGSLFMSIPLLTGPIGSALVDRYGCRRCTMIGGFVAGLGFMLSAFQDSLGMLYLTFGLIAGVGLGLCYVTAVVSIAYWFDRRRTLATGLGACGTGAGTVVFAPITSYCLAEYGWRGTILLLAGAMFNMCVCGALMRGPGWWADKAHSVAGTKSLRESCNSVSAMLDLPELKRLLQSGETLTACALQPDDTESYKLFHSAVALPTYVTHSADKFVDLVGHYPGFLASRSLSDGSKVNVGTLVRSPPTRKKVSPSGDDLLASLPELDDYTATSPPVLNNTSYSSPLEHPVTLPPGFQHPLTSPPGLHDTLTSPPGLHGPLTSPPRLHDTLTSLPGLHDPLTSPPGLHGPLTSPPGLHDPLTSPPGLHDPLTSPPGLHDTLTSSPGLHDPLTSPPELKPAIKKAGMHHKQQHYLRNIRVHRNSVMYRGAMLNTHRYRLRASSCPNIYRNSMTTIARESQEKWYTDMVELVIGMFRDFSMFRELHFLLMSVATILLFTWFIVPYFYLADHAHQNLYNDEQVASLLMIIGVTNFIGMVFLGWAGDQPWMNVTKTYAGCLVACGVSTLAMPVCTQHYSLLCTACALFGLFSASSFPFTPVILVELIPLERFTTAYGLSLLCQGIGSLLGPPLAGWLYDMTRTYHLSFHMAGAWIILAGILVAMIPATDNRTLWGAGALEKSAEITAIPV